MNSFKNFAGIHLVTNMSKLWQQEVENLTVIKPLGDPKCHFIQDRKISLTVLDTLGVDIY